MPNVNRLVGYLASVTSASLFYVVWFVVSFEQNRTPDGHVTVLFKIGLALFFWFFEGMCAAFVLMAFPWYLAVVSHSSLGMLRRTSKLLALAYPAMRPKPQANC